MTTMRQLLDADPSSAFIADSAVDALLRSMQVASQDAIEPRRETGTVTMATTERLGSFSLDLVPTGPAGPSPLPVDVAGRPGRAVASAWPCPSPRDLTGRSSTSCRRSRPGHSPPLSAPSPTTASSSPPRGDRWCSPAPTCTSWSRERPAGRQACGSRRTGTRPTTSSLGRQPSDGPVAARASGSSSPTGWWSTWPTRRRPRLPPRSTESCWPRPRTPPPGEASRSTRAGSTCRPACRSSAVMRSRRSSSSDCRRRRRRARGRRHGPPPRRPPRDPRAHRVPRPDGERVERPGADAGRGGDGPAA